MPPRILADCVLLRAPQWLVLLGLLAPSALAAGPLPDRSSTVVIEAEQFQYPGPWNRTLSANCSGGAYLLAGGPERDALTAFEAPADGTYHVWTRSRCFQSDKPGTRRFQVVINGTPVARESGASSGEGWIWERVGDAPLAKGPNVIALHDSARFFGRCDALLLTTTPFDPSPLKPADWKPWLLDPVPVSGTAAQPIAAPPPLAADAITVAQATGDQLRLSFLRTTDDAGHPVIVRRTALNRDGHWQAIGARSDREALYLIASPTSRVSVAEILPSWFSSQNVVRISVHGKTYEAGGNAHDPFFAGSATLLVPRLCRPLDAHTVEVDYAGANGEQAIATWRVTDGRRDASCTVRTRMAQEGDYALAFCAGEPTTPAQLQAVLLPPVFRFQRIHPDGFLVTSSTTSHPLSLVQTADTSGSPVTCLVAADPAALPFEWAQNSNARYGFSLRNAQGGIQPVIFRPVLGLPDSHRKAGEELTASWRVLSLPGTWTEALEYAAQTLFGVHDYRRPVNASLSEAAENLFDLLADDAASAWQPTLKGFAQIESRDTASQIAPLALLEIARLSRDESFYTRRALPAIEYTLSRPGAHFTTNAPAADSSYVTARSVQLGVPSTFFGTAYWQGLHDMLGRANPWVAEFALTNGQPRWNHSYSAVPHWSELLAANRLAPDPARLSQIRQEADTFVRKELHSRKTGDIDLLGFCNVQAYPYWWDLLDLHELTGDQAYLDAAVEGGFHTIAALWSQPTPPAGMVRIHPGDTFNEHPLMWWRGHEKFRLGWPRKPGDLPAHDVPAWLVSNVGLGVEQLSTYYDSVGNRGMQNILMSAWAPHLQRLYNRTGRTIFQDCARNGIIGRFASYPGYYVSGHTDAYQDPRYPDHGPDVTDLYYHHIPAHAAFTLDFLVAEAEGRSHQAIDFPWVKQQGYVWFSNRIFGGAPGRVFDDQAVELRLERKAARVAPEAISCLMGRGRNQYWLILMNEADTAVTARVQVDAAATGVLTGSPCRGLDAAGHPLASRPFAAEMTQEVPAKGLVALAFPAAADATVCRTLPPVRNGHLVQPGADAWGDLHAFRIRSPFGRDSLYAVLTGRPKPGARATLELNGHDQKLTADRYPYEFSLYPWPMERDMAFRVTLTDPDSPAPRILQGTMPGTP